MVNCILLVLAIDAKTHGFLDSTICDFGRTTNAGNQATQETTGQYHLLALQVHLAVSWRNLEARATRGFPAVVLLTESNLVNEIGLD